MFFAIVLGLVVAVSHSDASGVKRNVCPSFMPDCECSTIARGVLVSCKNFVNRTQLTSTLHDLRGYELHKFTMINFSISLQIDDFSEINLYNMNVESSNLKVEAKPDGYHLETFNTLEALAFHNSILDFDGSTFADMKLSILWFDECEFNNYRPEWFKELSVQSLKIENCERITQPVAQNLIGLVKYNYIRCGLTELHRGMLPTNGSSLEELDFSFNEITSISDDLFSGLTSLKKVDLSNNELTMLNETTFKTFNGILLLSDNPLQCNENIFWLSKRLQEGSIHENFPLICYDEEQKRRGIRDLITIDTDSTTSSTMADDTTSSTMADTATRSTMADSTTSSATTDNTTKSNIVADNQSGATTET